MRVQRCRARNSATVYPSPRLAPVIRATRAVGAGAPGLELCAMSAQGRRRFISLLVYKMYKHPTRLEPTLNRPVAHLWPVAVPLESMVLDIRAARNHLLHRLREAPKASSPADLQSYVGSPVRSEEHTSELQSRLHLVCRLLLEKKKNNRQSLLHCGRSLA